MRKLAGEEENILQGCKGEEVSRNLVCCWNEACGAWAAVLVSQYTGVSVAVAWYPEGECLESLWH